MNLLGSLLQQLVGRLGISDEIFSLYKSHQRRNTTPRLSEISTLLRSVLSTFSRTFIIIDALDECSTENDTKTLLLEEIRNLQPDISLLVTSRPMENLQDELTVSASLQIGADDQDISSYISSRIQKEHRLKLHVLSDPNLQNIIVQTIVEGAKGM